MKNIKMYISIVLMLVISVLLVSCGDKDNNTETNSDESVTLNAWVLPFVSEEKWGELEEEFNSEHNDIKVDITVLPWSNGREQIKTSLSTKDGPDVFYIPVGLDQDYIDGEILQPVTSLGVEEEQLKKYSSLIETNSVEGEVYALPLAYDLVMLYYNKEILEEYGFDNPPSTYEELYSMAETISQDTMKKDKPEVMGVQYAGMDDHQNFINHLWETIFRAEGGNYITDGSSSINSPEGMTSLEYLIDFYENNVSVPGPSAVDGFENGSVAMTLNIQTVAPDRDWFNMPDFKEKWGIAPLPKGSASSAGYLGGHSIAVNSNSKNIDAASEFVNWISSPDKASVWMERNLVPAYDLDKLEENERNEINEVIDSDPDTWNAIYDQVDANIEGGMMDLIGQKRLGYTQRWDTQISQLISAISGQTTAEDALEQIDRQVDQDISR